MPPKTTTKSTKTTTKKPIKPAVPTDAEASGPPSLRAVPTAARALGLLAAADGTIEPATVADVQSAAALPPATIEQASPPSIAQIQVLGSSATQAALQDHAATLRMLGHDGQKLATDSLAAIAAGERTIRLFESAYRSFQDYQERAKAIRPEMSELAKTLRGLDAASPLRAAFKSFIDLRDLSHGVPDAKRTRERLARQKKDANGKAKPT